MTWSGRPVVVRMLALDPADLRTSGAVMLGAAAVLPLLPGHPGVACPLRRVTGVPCPLCGMTTSVEDGVRLHLGNALKANPGGLAAIVAALLLLVVRPGHVRIPALLPPLVLAGLWLFELHRFSVL
jgi:Protein of unknown function (DUF2752)